MFIVEDTSVYKLFKMKKKLISIKKENIKKANEIKLVKLKTIQLRTDKHELERFAREQYLMKKNNEVIYIVNEL